MLEIARGVYDKRRERHRFENALRSAYWSVEVMSKEQCAQLLRESIGAPLAESDADLVQMAAAKIGATIAWRHCKLTMDAEWKEGRGDGDSR